MAIRQMTDKKLENKVFTHRDPRLIGSFLPEMLGKYSPWLRGVYMESGGPRDVLILSCIHKDTNV